MTGGQGGEPGRRPARASLLPVLWATLLFCGLLGVYGGLNLAARGRGTAAAGVAAAGALVAAAGAVLLHRAGSR